MRTLIKDIRGNRPLLISPTQAEAYLARTAGVEVPLGAKLSDMGDMLAALFGAKPTLEKFPPYAIVPIKGCIGRDLTELESLCGACDIKDVEEMLEEAERDPAVKTIILDIDSPGGTSVGVPELANRIKNSTKEVITFTSGECCSAAYWLGSQAREFYATPSSSIGSVGVYICFTDASKYFADNGLKQIVVKAGFLKGAGIDGTSLTPEQDAMLQAEVDDIWSDFKAAVTSVREFVDDASMQGQPFSGKRGAEAGLATSLVNGFDELMQALDSRVAEQMEADEENDAREEAVELGAGEEHDADEKALKRFASVRALKGLKNARVLAKGLIPAPKAAKGDEDTENAEPMPKAGRLPVEAGKPVDPSDPEDPDYDPDQDPELNCVVSDFDGTIRVDDSDMLDEAVAKHLARMTEEGKQVHVVTGRHESRRAETAKYLNEHGIKHEALHMKQDEKQETPRYKVDAVKKIEAEHGKVKHIVENDLACVEAYEAAGWHCIHPDTLNEVEDAADSGERGVDTDKKTDRSETERHRGGSIT